MHNFKIMMKYIIVFILTIFNWTSCVGQELVTIRDTVNHFAVGVPVGWRYGVPVDKSLVFVALRQKQNDQDISRENFNLNLLHHDETDLSKSFKKFTESIRRAEGFKIIDEGEKTINNRKYKYLIETHKNTISNEDMSNYVLYANKDGEVLVLTMVTTFENFEKFKSLFDSIAISLVY